MERWMGEMSMHVLQMSSGHVKAEQAAPLLACHAAPRRFLTRTLLQQDQVHLQHMALFLLDSRFLAPQSQATLASCECASQRPH